LPGSRVTARTHRPPADCDGDAERPKLPETRASGARFPPGRSPAAYSGRLPILHDAHRTSSAAPNSRSGHRSAASRSAWLRRDHQQRRHKTGFTPERSAMMPNRMRERDQSRREVRNGQQRADHRVAFRKENSRTQCGRPSVQEESYIRARTNAGREDQRSADGWRYRRIPSSFPRFDFFVIDWICGVRFSCGSSAPVHARRIRKNQAARVVGLLRADLGFVDRSCRLAGGGQPHGNVGHSANEGFAEAAAG